MFEFFGPSTQLSLHDRARLQRVEQKLDLILSHLGIAFEEKSRLPAEARVAADAGQKIAAIKALREATGIGLVEAKAEIESYLAGR